MKINIPQIVKDISLVLKNNGNQSFVVGGAVRDFIMNVDSDDIDIATDLLTDDVILLFKNQDFTEDIKRTGDKFPVARIFTKCGHEFEIATFRADTGEGEDTDFKIVSNIKEDVLRRDFTFNGLFADGITGEITDLVGGIDDIKNKIIRFIGDPVKRINEDRTRLLRLARFKNRFGFKIIDLELIIKNNSLINGLLEKDRIKKEMIITELLKGVKQSDKPSKFMKTLLELGLLEQMFPGLNVNLTSIDSKNVEILLIEILAFNKTEKVLKTLKDMKWSSIIIDRVFCILSFGDKDSIINNVKGFPRFIKKIESCRLKEVLTESIIDSIWKTSNTFVKSIINFELTVKNTDFPNIKPGPELGEAIQTKEMELFKNLL